MAEPSESRQPATMQLPIKDAYVVTMPRYHDHRGYFSELYNDIHYTEAIRGSLSGHWQQVAVSSSSRPHTLRGLHMSPYNKFCTILSGSIYDVIVDMREGSPTYLKWCGVYLSEENKRQVHIPANCAHGFLTLHPNTRMLYLQGGTFCPSKECDCNAFDKFIDIYWPLLDSTPIMSGKDRNAPILSTLRPTLQSMTAKKRVLIIGSSGQVGSALLDEFNKAGYLVYGTHNSNPFPGEVTIQCNLETVADSPLLADEVLGMMRPHLVIICASFTWVDGAEDAEEKCHKVNVLGPLAFASSAKKIGAKLIAYGTDYVWDGSNGPYSEADPCNPLNVYGKSKLEMEKALLNENNLSLILRTTVVFGPDRQGKNFVYQLSRSLNLRKEMTVASDQVSTPTYSRDLALLTRLLVEGGASGIFNATGQELLGRYDFAVKVAKALSLDHTLIKPCTTAQQNQKALRPLNAGMQMMKALSFLNGRFKPRSVEEAILDWINNPGHDCQHPISNRTSKL